jgi:ankyrin repeat protein
VDVLLELGAVVDATDTSSQTPLHAAAFRRNIDAAVKLLARGAVVDAREKEGLTPLELALQSCANSELPEMVELARLLFGAGAKRTAAMRGFVEEIGTRFEFHRSG